MIVVATDDFEVYHEVVTELRDRGVQFTTLEPAAELPDDTTLVITTPSDSLDLPPAIERINADPTSPRKAVDAALAGERPDDARCIVGVDPGTDIGIAVLAGDDVVAAFQVPLTDAPNVIRREISDAVNPVVRVGNGARRQSARIIEALSDVRVELVDETGTTPHVGTGARGSGDILAAVNIARRSGDAVDHRTIEPTSGEIQVVKAASRERSAGNRTIPEALARQVAKGELTVEEALDQHQDG